SSQPAPTPSLQPTSQPAPTPSLQPTSQPAPTPRESRPSQTPSSTPIPTSQPAPTPSLQPSSQLAPTPRESRPPQTPSSTPIPTSKSTPTDEDCENYKDCGDYEDYSRLEELLQDNEWQKANEETSKILLQYSNKKTHLDTYTYKDLKIPQDVYLEIDRLWREYSRGHFGMSVQNSIWKEVTNWFIKQSKNCSGSDEKIEHECFKKFAKQVGHLDHSGNYLQIGSLNYNKNAPKGHLPIVGLPFITTYNLASRVKNQLTMDNKYR
ncbi:MAG: GUN4 domain-containing protein, partial [Cyanobacteria bacterium J06643_5]